MIIKTEMTYQVNIHMAGEINTAKQVCREFCMSGLCVHIHPQYFIYTGGAEDGFKIGLLNYPRFPSSPDEIFDKADTLARMLLERLFQHSALIVAPDSTVWLTKREEPCS